MIDWPLLIAFLVAASILTVTPGVDTAMVLRAAAVGGRRQAVLAALGIAAGCLAWAVIVSLGLGAVLAASDVAFTAVKLAGAAYLVWLGAKLLLSPRDALGEGGNETASGSAFRRGLLTNLLNPKVGVFYVSFLPQFVPAGSSVPAWSLVLASIHVGLSLVWFALLIAAIASIGRALREPSAVRSLDRATGAVFVGFGLRLAVSTRA